MYVTWPKGLLRSPFSQPPWRRKREWRASCCLVKGTPSGSYTTFVHVRWPKWKPVALPPPRGYWGQLAVCATNSCVRLLSTPFTVCLSCASYCHLCTKNTKAFSLKFMEEIHFKIMSIVFRASRSVLVSFCCNNKQHLGGSQQAESLLPGCVGCGPEGLRFRRGSPVRSSDGRTVATWAGCSEDGRDKRTCHTGQTHGSLSWVSCT